MSRRLIIIILIVLIVGVLGGTVALLVQRFGGSDEVAPDLLTDNPDLTPADDGAAQIIDPTGDSDNDGLPNAQEVIWGTNPNLGDTDGDGFTDSAEIANNHNPTIAGPNDTLPAGFQPQVDIQPAAPLQIDQYFAAKVDLFPLNGRNLTTEYNARYPEKERTTENAVTFAKEQSIVRALPQVDETKITLTQGNSTQTVGHYLDVARGYSQLMDSTTVGEIMLDIFDHNDISSTIGMAEYVQSFQQQLTEAPVPPEALNLHKLLIGFTEVLNATYIQMTVYENDPIKTLNAIYQLETIDQQYLPLITSEYRRLEQKY